MDPVDSFVASVEDAYETLTLALTESAGSAVSTSDGGEEKGTGGTGMNAERRKAIAKVQLEKQRLASGVTQAQVDDPLKSSLVFSKHFMIEPQADQDSDSSGDDVYAVYRLTDLLSSLVSDISPLPEPVHICDLLIDAMTLVSLLDMLVERDDKDATTVTDEWYAIQKQQAGAIAPPPVNEVHPVNQIPA